MANGLIDKNRDVAVYEQIYTILKSRIDSGEYKSGGRLPSTRGLADEFEVNHLTVRQALKKLESERLIHSKVGHGTFVNERLSRYGKVMIIYSSLYNEFSHAISSNLITHLRKAKLDFEAADYLGDERLRNHYYERVSDDGIGGAILLEAPIEKGAVRPLLKVVTGDKPVIMVDSRFADVPCNCIQSDNVAGGLLAGEHLIAKGVRHPAFVSGCDVSTVRARLKGFMNAIIRYESVSGTEDMILHDCLKKHGTFRKAMEFLMRSDTPPDGIFFENDYVAIECMHALHELGYSVPGDVAVIGFDDVSICPFTHPPLTTIRQDASRIGTQACELYLELMEMSENERAQGTIIDVPVTLIERESTNRNV